jgi:opacity protein-like surface antigen
MVKKVYVLCLILISNSAFALFDTFDNVTLPPFTIAVNGGVVYQDTSDFNNNFLPGTLAIGSSTSKSFPLYNIGLALILTLPQGMPLKAGLFYDYITDVDYQFPSLFPVTNPNVQLTASLNSQLLMVNFLYDLDPWGNIQPYIGAGVGASRNRVTSTFSGTLVPSGLPVSSFWRSPISATETAVAWDIILGADYAINSNLKFGANVRFIDRGKVVIDHSSGANNFVVNQFAEANKLLNTLIDISISYSCG